MWARAINEAVFTQADTLEELRALLNQGMNANFAPIQKLA
jgi:hypothetical protein